MSKKYNLGTISDESSGVYSMDEVCVGTWMGKPLYRRVYKSVTPNKSGGYDTIDISDIDYDYIQIKNYNIQSQYVLVGPGCEFTGLTINVWIRNKDVVDNPNQIVMQISGTNTSTVSTYLSCPYYVIIEYTKQSDS